MLLLAAAVLLAFPPRTGAEIQPNEIRERTEQYAIDIRYPVIARDAAFNRAVRRIVKQRVEEFKRSFETPAPGAGQGKKSPPRFPPGSLHGRYTATALANGIVSVLLGWDEYHPGAAHPGSGLDSVNYDTHAGRVLALSDLFRPGADYLTRVSELAIAGLNEQESADAHWVSRGAAPVASNFTVFTLTNTSLVLHFPTYQVAPGAAGPRQVTIPLTVLAPLLR